MTDALLSDIIGYIRSHTALPAWFAEILTVFVLCTGGRFALAVWLQTQAATATTPATPWWQNWLYAYDNLRAYADDALIAALLFAIILEGGIMFLAKKRIALSGVEGEARGEARGIEKGRVEGREEGIEEGIAKGRAETEAKYEPLISEMREYIRQLESRNGKPDA